MSLIKIFIWILSVFSLSLILGEICYQLRKIKKEENSERLSNIPLSAEDTIDIPICEFEPVKSRKEKELTTNSFRQIRDREYKKML